MSYKLCYVDMSSRCGVLYFTDNFDNQWGDDWRKPYSNSGTPYENIDDIMATDCGHIRRVGFSIPINCENYIACDVIDRDFSPEDANKLKIAWLSHYELGGLLAGTSIKKAVEWLRRANIMCAELR